MDVILHKSKVDVMVSPSFPCRVWCECGVDVILHMSKVDVMVFKVYFLPENGVTKGRHQNGFTSELREDLYVDFSACILV